MHELELILGLLAAVVVMAAVADRLHVPHPLAQVFAGMVLGAAPFIPIVTIDPELVLLVLLAPALFSAAIALDWTAFQQLRRPILSLAVRLVITSTVTVALVSTLLIGGMEWSAAFVLGAIVSPPDAVATLSIARRLGIPANVLTVLEGESLVNDATALVLYRVAVSAVVTGGFSLLDLAGELVYVAVIGVGIGLAVGFMVFTFLSRFVTSPAVSAAVSLMTPVISYLIAEEAGASGVLAVVVAGLVTTRQTLRASSSQTRVQIVNLWQVVSFVVEGFAFVLIGLQLPIVVGGIRDIPAGELAWYTFAIVLTTITVRVVWVLFEINDDVIQPGGTARRVAAGHPARLGLGPALWRRVVLRRPIGRRVAPRLAGSSVIAWSGLRGIVTLATALAIPYERADGTPFPHRDLIIFLAFCVILATLVGQGMTLPLLIRRLRFPPEPDNDLVFRETMRSVFEAGIARLDELRADDGASVAAADRVRNRLLSQFDELDRSDADVTSSTYRIELNTLLSEVEEAERRALRQLADTGRISDRMRRRIERRIDLRQVSRIDG